MLRSEVAAATGPRPPAPDRGTLAAVRAPLKHYLRALWGAPPSLHELPEAIETVRTRISNIGVHLPPRMRTWRGSLAEQAYFAAAAHAAAHLAYSTHKHPVGSLKPLQRVLVGALEDARVEHLAARQMPGLSRLWLSLHEPAGRDGIEVRVLLARLSRALLDERSDDTHPWVAKARALFHADAGGPEGPLADPAALRDLASRLGNDLGQMRLQFDARSWSVEPAYRDDNGHLWERSADEPPDDAVAELRGGGRAAPQGSGVVQRRQTLPAAALRSRPADAGASAQEAEAVQPHRRYREWDRLIETYRDDWATVIDEPVVAEATSLIAASTAADVKRLRHLLQASQIERPVRRRGVHEGETLDLDAAIDHHISRRQGLLPDRGVYVRTQKRRHELAVLLLLDLSRSVSSPTPGRPQGVLPLIRDAATLAARAIVGAGDACAIHAFRSEGRHRVHYLRIKDFEQPLADDVLAALQTVRGDFSTRLGAAIRHATWLSNAHPSQHRLVIVLSDGEPYDIDVHDPGYLLADAHRAVLEARARRIDVCGLDLAPAGAALGERIFGRRSHVAVPDLEALPAALRALYVRLAR